MSATDVLGLIALLPELPTERTRLLDNLGRIRRELGPITPELSDALADHMNLRHGEVHEVQSFYSFLRVPTDALRVCTGPVCDCAGARELLARTREHAPREATVIEVPCLGHCDV
ncbi:MAG: NAD(P)H-dependent oxidoreductase subunit E, partial [Actinobacteria bacterium]|nr:NAD(P)H-dependent oxidoreductase subunit E [Actinomycetota bacterium]